MKKRSIIAALIIILTLAACGTVQNASVPASDYPTKPITIIVPFKAGGGADLSARAMAPLLAKELGQNVIISNQPGAIGEIGFGECYRAAPDGYTLASGNTALALISIGNDSVSYNYEEFEYLLATSHDPWILFASVESGIKTIEDLQEYAETEQALCASSGWAATCYWTDLMDRIDVGNYTFVPFSGNAESIMGVVSGDCTVGISAGSAVKSSIESGQVQAICTLWTERPDAYPEIPSSAEAGFPDLVYTTVRGFIAPPGTPEEICKTLTDALLRVVEQDAFKEAESNLGYINMVLDGSEYKEMLRQTHDTIERLMEEKEIRNTES